MFRKGRIGLFFGISIAIILIVAGSYPAFAAPPTNDDIGAATEIGGLPFTDSLDTTEATPGVEDPWLGCYGDTLQATVWYKFTPTESISLDASTEGSDYTTVTGVFVDMGGLSEITCAYDSTVTFYAYSGETYYIMVGATTDPGPYPGPYPPPGDVYGGNLVFTLQERQLAPPEARFGYWRISGLNYEFYNNSWDPEGYGFESAFWDFGDGGTSTELYLVTHEYAQEGSYLVTLTVTTSDGRPDTYTEIVDTTLPQPEAIFGYDPYDPSIFDTVQFYNFSMDPAYVNMTSYWEFGDGTTSVEWSPVHRYETDGSYLVTLVVTTEDGRSDTTSLELVVSTHDVAIKKFKVPKAVKVGQTRQLEVGITNVRQPETVEVYLYKSTNDHWDPWQYVGSLTQYVPVRSANRTTAFSFAYTFTVEDGEVGKINFKAEAVIRNARDALNGDNTVISLPVKVNP
jgi:PKD repeat protein